MVECLRDGLGSRFNLRQEAGLQPSDAATDAPSERAAESTTPEPTTDEQTPAALAQEGLPQEDLPQEEVVADESIAGPVAPTAPGAVDQPPAPEPQSGPEAPPADASAAPVDREVRQSEDRLAHAPPVEAPPPAEPIVGDPSPVEQEAESPVAPQSPAAVPDVPLNLPPQRLTIVADIPPTVPEPMSDAGTVPAPAEPLPDETEPLSAGAEPDETATVPESAELAETAAPEIAALPRIFYDRPLLPLGDAPAPTSVPYAPMPPPLEPTAPQLDGVPGEAPVPAGPEVIERPARQKNGQAAGTPQPPSINTPRLVAPDTAASPAAEALPKADALDGNADQVPPLVQPPAIAADLRNVKPVPDDAIPSAPGNQQLAAVGDEEIALEPPPVIEAPPIEPTIDAIEIDGLSSFFAGEGPDGAEMQLFVDDLKVGSGDVDGGRWVVEARDILRGGEMTIRVDAIDGATGEMLGTATILIEIALPADAVEAPEPVAEPPVEPTSQEESEEDASPAQQTSPEPSAPVASPPAERSGSHDPQPVAPAASAPADDPAEPDALEDDAAPTDPASPPDVAPLPAAGSDDEPGDQSPSEIVPEVPPNAAPAGTDPLPPIRPTTPAVESDSVEILPPPRLRVGTSSIEQLPTSPAIVANLTVPRPAAGAIELPGAGTPSVVILLPFGDPARSRFRAGKAIIRPGDTLWAISRRYYGRGIHYDTIVNANRSAIRRPSRIYPGQVLDLPLVFDD